MAAAGCTRIMPRLGCVANPTSLHHKCQSKSSQRSQLSLMSSNLLHVKASFAQALKAINTGSHVKDQKLPSRPLIRKRGRHWGSSLSIAGKQHLNPGRVRRTAAVAAGEGDGDGSENEGEGIMPRTPSELDKMRAELEALQAELDETRSKANAARDRFMRLTSAVEKKRAAAEKAVRAGDEAVARRLLHEKASVLQALEKSQQRAEVLQALAIQLGKVISRKETLYITALSSVKRAADSPSPRPAPAVTIIEPSQPPPSLEKEEAAQREEAAAQDVSSLVEGSAGLDDLNDKFLDMERTTLERMFTQSPSAEADRRSPGEPSTSSPSPKPDLRPTADLYRQEVTRQIAEVELKLAVLESDRAEKMEGRDPTAGDSEAGVTMKALEERIQKAREVLARLRLVEWKIQDGAFETSYEQDSAGKRAPWPEIKVQEQPTPAKEEKKKVVREPTKKVLRALDYIRQKDQVGAGSLLQQLLAEEPSEDWTWDRLAGESGPDSITSGERAELYHAYLRHVLLPEATTEPLPPNDTASYLGAAASRILDPPQTSPPPPNGRPQALQTFLGLPPGARDAAHREAFKEVLTSAALESQEWELPSFGRLRAELALAGHVAEDLRSEAEALGRYRRLVGTVLRDLREVKGGVTGRSVDWQLTGEHRRELANWRVQLSLPPQPARLAAGAACRAVLQELLQTVLEVQRKSGGLVPPVAAELDNLVRFAREAALPALKTASAEQDDSSESAAARPGVSQSAATASGSVSGMPPSTALTLGKASERSSEEGRVSAQDLRLLVFGGAAESLLSAYLENAYKQRTARVLTSDEEDLVPGDGLQGVAEQDEAIDRNVLAGLLGVSASVAGALQRAAAASAYAELSKRAMADAYISSESRRQLDRARAALGLGEAESRRIEQEAAAVRIGAAAKKLLDKRSRGRDVTSADVRLLASMCENLQVVRVAQVDSRDAVVLYKRAAQTVLEEGSARSVNPGQLVLEGKALLQRLVKAFGITEADVWETLSAVMDGAAKAALVQARASLRRGDPSLAADDVTRLAVALAYKPEADVAKGALPESEARDLYSLYSSRHGRAREGGMARSELTILQEEMLRRLAKHVGLL